LDLSDMIGLKAALQYPDPPHASVLLRPRRQRAGRRRAAEEGDERAGLKNLDRTISGVSA
jgi:hypothetical protein